MRWSEWRALMSGYVAPHRRLLVLLGFATLIGTALQVATPQAVRVFIDRATSSDRSPVGLLAVLYIMAVIAQQAFRVLSSWLGEQLGWLATNELRVDLLAHCLELDPDFHVTHSPGELIERIDGDVNGLSTFFAQFVLTVVTSMLLLVFVLGIVWLEHPLAGAAFTVFAAAAIAAMASTRKVAAPAWGRAREASGLLYGFLEERLAGTVDLRSSNAEAHTLRGFYGLARDRTWISTRARLMDAIGWAANGWITAASNALAFVVPAVLVGRGDLTIGGAFVLYFYAQLLMQPLNDVTHQVEQLQQAIAGGRRVVALLALAPNMVDGPGAPLPAGALSVELRDVGFGYTDDPDVLTDLNLLVPAGGVLGVVGRTGSGKSSVARLIVRLHDPRRGVVEVGGVDARALHRAELRRRVTLVTQDVHVLAATVRENLTLFDDTVADDALHAAIDTLGLRRWLDRLPAGLDTALGEGGIGLSAGEAQLLAFARAFLLDPSVVVLDEASSRLDPATEAMLEGAIDGLLIGRTAIVIAHRLATLDRCDAICVLEGGRVLEYGPRAALVADPDSHFSELLRVGLDAGRA